MGKCFYIISHDIHVAYTSCGRIASPLFEFVLVVLTVVNYRAALKEGWAKGSVLEILARDGLWAFTTILGNFSAFIFAIVHQAEQG
jgi:hypothetical protein